MRRPSHNKNELPWPLSDDLSRHREVFVKYHMGKPKTVMTRWNPVQSNAIVGACNSSLNTIFLSLFFCHGIQLFGVYFFKRDRKSVV